jgi:hypothetical protein
MNTFAEAGGNSHPAITARTPCRTNSNLTVVAAIVEAELCRSLSVASERLHFARQGRRRISDARRLVIYLLMTVAGATARDAAAHFGRHRSSGLHAMRCVEARREADPAFDIAVEALEQVARAALAMRCPPTAVGHRLLN